VRLAVFREDQAFTGSVDGAGSGQYRLGVVSGDSVTDVTSPLGVAGGWLDGPLPRLLELAANAETLADSINNAVDDAVRHGHPRRLANLRMAAPVPRPGKVIGAPVNYRDHQAEMESPTTLADLGVFLKAPSSVIGHGDRVRLPYTDRRTDQEAELAAVIGRTARHVSAAEAVGVVAGYTCALDMTVRGGEDRSTRKSFDTFCPLGPWLVTPDEVGDPGALRLRCWVNGEPRQDASTGDMIFDVPHLIAYASAVMTLHPGDVLVTGTPAGVGPVADGDTVAVEIERVGRLEVTVTADGAVPYDSRPGPPDQP
jgi:2-keto-4-pentenoate hydratase/2-oxohepta-3-ene-1,7-dioic acid hydratase in catechol pathway